VQITYSLNRVDGLIHPAIGVGLTADVFKGSGSPGESNLDIPLDVCDTRHTSLYPPSHQAMAVQPYDLTVKKNQS
jgi:hypothetical protein